MTAPGDAGRFGSRGGAAWPRARLLGMVVTGIAPRIMGVRLIEAAGRLSRLAGVALERLEVIELNEAFARHAIATLRDLGSAADDPRVQS